MKKISIMLLVLAALTVSGCNYQMVDLDYKYDYAVIQMPNGQVVEGRVESWRDYDGEQLQVKINGVTYLCSSFNTVLMKKGEQ